jgi:hypothetical protein
VRRNREAEPRHERQNQDHSDHAPEKPGDQRMKVVRQISNEAAHAGEHRRREQHPDRPSHRGRKGCEF